MIRGYEKHDVDPIMRMLNLNDTFTKEKARLKRQELVEGARAFIYEDKGVAKGVCVLTFLENVELGNYAEVIIAIEDKRGFSLIANYFWEYIQKIARDEDIVYLITRHKDIERCYTEFYDTKGFEHWLVVHKMLYTGKQQEPSELNFRTYEDKDFYLYGNSIGDAFFEIREANNSKPYNIFSDLSAEKSEKFRKEMEELKDKTYMFFNGSQFVGAALIKGAEIDDVFVVQEYQGRGFGRKIMHEIINIALKEALEEVTLGVVSQNQIAKNLYKSLGFETYEVLKYRRLF